jgi:hypothetical protein
MFKTISSIIGGKRKEVEAHEINPNVDEIEFDDTQRKQYKFPSPIKKRRYSPIPFIPGDPIPVNPKPEPYTPNEPEPYIPGSGLVFPCIYQLQQTDFIDGQQKYIFDTKQELALLSCIDYLSKLYSEPSHKVFNYPHYAKQMRDFLPYKVDLTYPGFEIYLIYLNLNVGQFVVQRVMCRLREDFKKNVPLITILMKDVLRTRFFKLLDFYSTEIRVNSNNTFQRHEIAVVNEQEVKKILNWFTKQDINDIPDEKVSNIQEREFHSELIQLQPPVPHNKEKRLIFWKLPDISIDMESIQRFMFKNLFSSTKPTIAYTKQQLEDRNYKTPKALDEALADIFLLKNDTSLDDLYRQCLHGVDSSLSILLADLAMTIETISLHLTSRTPYRKDVINRLGINRKALRLYLANKMI